MLKFCAVKDHKCAIFDKWLPLITIYSDGHMGMPLMTLNRTHSSAKEASIFGFNYHFVSN